MARDDYFVIVYKILTYLYECLKRGTDIDTFNILNAETYNINQSYFEYILVKLQEEGYIEGVKIVSVLGAKRKVAKLTNNIIIEPKGIEYLQNNSIFEKVKNAIKEIKDTIPGL